MTAMTDAKIVIVTLRRDATSCVSLEAERQRCVVLRTPICAGETPIGLDVSTDVVRARSNAVAFVLSERPLATHVLWWDEDVIAPQIQTIARMLSTGHDVVGCPVPRKRIARWGDELQACDFAYRVSGPDGGTMEVKADEAGCVQVDALPFGLLVTTTRCLRQMCEHYDSELWYRDGGNRAVALFQLMLTDERLDPEQQPHRELLSEDYSFCARWRAMGGKVHMFLESAHHVGSHVFRGHVSGLHHVR